MGVFVAEDDGQPHAAVLLQMVEGSSMRQGKISAHGAAWDKSFARTGKVELYGDHFVIDSDSDSDTLQPDSKPTLDEMAKALKAAPSLKIHIVGHTDNRGSLVHNLELLKKRAQAMVDALQTTCGISVDRLAATGPASYSPVAANTNSAAKAKNWRGEMVAQ